MTDSALVKVSGVSKIYPRVHRPIDRLRGLLTALAGRPHAKGDAVVEDVSLTVQPGQSVAIIGENGAGKSSLLKLIAGVLRPSSGQIQMAARVGALLEVGAGFQPEESGLDNARMAAILLGAEAGELDRLLPEIIAFAAIGDAIDEPVKHYSSGMTVRLGFAVIAAMRPELLITDEVLAVGDEAFQRKCIAWLEGYLEQGGTLLLVTHNLFQVQKLCHKAYWMRAGRIEREGDVFDVCQAYLAYHQQRQGIQDEAGSSGPAISELQILIDGETAAGTLEAGKPMVLAFDLHCQSTSSLVHLSLYDMHGVQLIDERRRLDCRQTKSRQLSIDTCALMPGRYQLDLAVSEDDESPTGPVVRRLLELRGKTREFGSVRLQHCWSGQRESV